MINLALLTGLYAYTLFFLGIGKILTSQAILLITVFFIICLLVTTGITWNKYRYQIEPLNKKVFFVIPFIIFQFLINLLGALGPEYSFDALWYHLVLPKLYIAHHTVSHIPGGLLYYSDMPKLGELLFTGALSIQSEILAKCIQLFFGVGICLLLYRFARKYYSQFHALLVVIIFYSNIVVAWESTVAYIDLIRTFYEFFALLIFIEWQKKQQDRVLILSSILLGFAITTKLLSLGSLGILSSMTLYFSYQQNKKIFSAGKKTVIYVLIALIIPLPWFIFSYVYTKNPLYPFFTPLYPTHASLSLINPFTFIHDIIIVFTHAADPVSPLYLIMFPLVYFFTSFRKEAKIITIYSACAILVWYVTPRTGGGRFILPYLPAFSLIAGEIFSVLSQSKRYTYYYLSLITVVFVIAISSLVYRSIAVSKYIPYLLGRESKQQFLLSHLNFAFGDFIDIDGGIQKHLAPSDVVLLIGFHNLYYVNFPFIDSSYIQKSDRFTYIATQHTTLPKDYVNAQKVYEEKRTGVNLYMVGENRWKIK